LPAVEHKAVVPSLKVLVEFFVGSAHHIPRIICGQTTTSLVVEGDRGGFCHQRERKFYESLR
jgi:hypothetical protein